MPKEKQKQCLRCERYKGVLRELHDYYEQRQKELRERNKDIAFSHLWRHSDNSEAFAVMEQLRDNWEELSEINTILGKCGFAFR